MSAKSLILCDPKSYHNPEFIFIWSRLNKSKSFSAEITSKSTPNSTQFIWLICAIGQNILKKALLTRPLSMVLRFNDTSWFNSKCLFSSLQFFQKTNENNSTWRPNFSVYFLEELRTLKCPFEINWPLE